MQTNIPAFALIPRQCFDYSVSRQSARMDFPLFPLLLHKIAFKLLQLHAPVAALLLLLCNNLLQAIFSFHSFPFLSFFFLFAAIH